jgi:hypothetical protein
VKETLANLLKLLLREKFHLKSEGEISTMCEQIQNGPNGIIEDIYWKKIITRMYDRDDVRILTERFMECIHTKKLIN